MSPVSQACRILTTTMTSRSDMDDDTEYRPLTKWDYVAGAVWLWGFGVLCGAVFTMWLGGHRG